MGSAPLRAVHDDDLTEFLRKLGLLGDVQGGRVQCRFCQDVISIQNLHAVFADSGKLQVSCDKPACVKALNAFVSEASQR